MSGRGDGGAALPRAVWWLALVVTFAVATRAATWWAVPLTAFVYGAWSEWRLRAGVFPPTSVAAAAVLAWALLLPWTTARAPAERLIGMLAIVAGVPARTFALLTLLFAALLGWSAATVGLAIGATVAPDERVDASS